MYQFRWLGVALLLYLGAAGIYLWAVPPLEGFDSIAHQNYVNYLRDTRRLPEINAETAAYSYELVQQPPLYYLISAGLTRPWPYADWHHYVNLQENTYFPELSARWSVDVPNSPPGLQASLWVAQLVSLLGGILAVIAAWLWMRALLYPHANVAKVPAQAGGDRFAQPALTLAAVLLFALNPLFLFLSVTVTNDAWAIAGTVAVMWLTTELARRAPRTAPSAHVPSSHAPSSHARYGMWVALGVIAGAAALVKYSVLSLIVPVGVILLVTYRRALRHLLVGSTVAVLAAFCIAGFWYGRNLLLYGEVLPATQLMQAHPGMRRATAMPWREVIENLPWLFDAYWGYFVAIFAPRPYYHVRQVFVVIGVAGLLWVAWQAFLQTRPRGICREGPGLGHRLFVYGVPVLWTVSVGIAFLVWMRTVAYGEQVRLMLIGGPAIALLLTLGWRVWFPRAVRPPLLYGLVVLYLAMALWPVSTLVANYRVPTGIEQAEFSPSSPTFEPVDATFVPGMELVGFDLPQGRVLNSQDAPPLVLYWTSDAPIQDDYTLFAHIATADDTMWYQYDGVPADGRHPTRQWAPAQVFSMTLELVPDPAVIPEQARPTLCHSRMANTGSVNSSDANSNDANPARAAELSVGFYLPDEPAARLPLGPVEPEIERAELETEYLDTDGGKTGDDHDRLVLGDVRLAPPAPESTARNGQESAAAPPVAAWQNGIRLHNVATDWRTVEDRLQLTLDVEWTTATLLVDDLTLFVHLLDAAGTRVAQADAQPCAGTLPTSTWQLHERIHDRYVLELPEDYRVAVNGAYELRLGWYDVATGVRSLRTAAAGAATADTDLVRLTIEPY